MTEQDRILQAYVRLLEHSDKDQIVWRRHGVPVTAAEAISMLRAQDPDAVQLIEDMWSVAARTLRVRLGDSRYQALMDDRDRLQLKLRRTLAAQSPGSDDEAFEGTGWVGSFLSDGSHAPQPRWTHPSGAVVLGAWPGRWVLNGLSSHSTAFSAMESATPELFRTEGD